MRIRRRLLAVGFGVGLAVLTATTTVALASKPDVPTTTRPANADQTVLTPDQLQAHNNSPVAKGAREARANQDADTAKPDKVNTDKERKPVTTFNACTEVKGKVTQIKGKDGEDLLTVPPFGPDGGPITSVCVAQG